jgi:hypothetical protein
MSAVSLWWWSSWCCCSDLSSPRLLLPRCVSLIVLPWQPYSSLLWTLSTPRSKSFRSGSRRLAALSNLWALERAEILSPRCVTAVMPNATLSWARAWRAREGGLRERGHLRWNEAMYYGNVATYVISEFSASVLRSWYTHAAVLIHCYKPGCLGSSIYHALSC